MSDEKVPFLDLVTVHRGLQDEFVDILKTALSTAGFIGGPMVQGFEEDFAQFCESRICVGVGSGTDALRFALIAAGIRPGDIVVTVLILSTSTNRPTTWIQGSSANILRGNARGTQARSGPSISEQAIR